jgi:hypothetical protein
MNKITIVSKNYGSQVIDLDTFNPLAASPASTIYKIAEHMFNEWYDGRTEPGAPMAKDIQGMYYGEADQPAIYTRTGAIQGGVEIIIEEIQEANTASGKSMFYTRDIVKMDVECAFE